MALLLRPHLLIICYIKRLNLFNQVLWLHFMEVGINSLRGIHTETNVFMTISAQKLLLETRCPPTGMQTKTSHADVYKTIDVDI